MSKIKKNLIVLLLLCISTLAGAHSINISTSADGKTVKSITVGGDTLNWVMDTDGSQYAWVTEKYAWGSALGLPEGVAVKVARQDTGNGVCETYMLTNTTDHDIQLANAAISTPFNDNYPSADVCMAGRCNAHIWAGGEGAWVKAMRMNGEGLHLGLAVTEGAVDGYEIWERDRKKGMSNFRGCIALRLPVMTLKAGQDYRLSWTLFTHRGHDFREKLLEAGGVWAESGRYVYNVGDTACVSFERGRNKVTVEKRIDKPGEIVVVAEVGGRKSKAILLGVSSAEGVISKRADFIVERQQMLRKDDPRYGAYMVYDCGGDSIVTNHHGRSDLDEGRERTGMGVFLAEYYKIHPSEKLLLSLELYAKFIRGKLQDDTYKTTSSVVKPAKNRGYNYAWVADFYFRMYDITGNVAYARHGYGTMKALFRMFGHGFYCIDYPVTVGLRSLRNAGMAAQADTLLHHFVQLTDRLCDNGRNFPKSEVNYEQSIIAPAVQVLCEMYLETREPRYLETAGQLMPPLEAFSAMQPSYRMNDIAIRHWDGYWFGKRCLWGDVYPHYWSAITAGAFHYYAMATGKWQYSRRARNIVLGNLCNFFENGEATCAHVLPARVNGENASHTDEYANDQDFALMYYLLVMKEGQGGGAGSDKDSTAH